MSTTRTDYIILGYKLPYGFFKDQGIDLDSAKYDDPTLWPDKYKIINDGMNGEYIVFGEVIQRADEFDGFDFHRFSVNLFTDHRIDEVTGMFVQLFGYDAVDSLENQTPSLLIFTHWS